MFPRHRIPYGEVLIGPPEDAEVHWFELEDGSGRVEAWFLEPLSDLSGPWPLAIVAHGNGEVIDRWAWKVQGLRERGFAVFLVEYPGYGRSTGKPSQVTVTETFIKAYDTVVKRPNINRDRIFLMGRSLGTGAVCTLSRKRTSRAMLLISPFTSIRPHAVKRMMPPMLVRDPFDNVQAVREYNGMLMIVHGQRDRLNPLKHAETLRQEKPESHYLIYPESAHHDCPPDWVKLYTDIDSFLFESGLISSSTKPSQ